MQQQDGYPKHCFKLKVTTKGPPIYGYPRKDPRLHHQTKQFLCSPPNSRETLILHNPPLETPIIGDQSSRRGWNIHQKLLMKLSNHCRSGKKKVAHKSRPLVAEKGKWVPKLIVVAKKCTLVDDHASTSNTITTKDTTTGFEHLTIK